MNALMMTPLNYDPKSPFNHLLRSLFLGMIHEGIKLKRIVIKNGREWNQSDVFQYDDDISTVEYLYVTGKFQEKNNFIGRYLRLWQVQFEMCIKFLAIKEVDVLFEDMSYASLLPILVSKLKKKSVVLMVQDVWPDNAVAAGLISHNGMLYHLFDFLQKPVYRWATKIVVISEDIKQLLIEKGVEANKVEVIYNWGYSDEIQSIKWSENEFVRKFHLSADHFYAIYAGSIGMLQNIGMILAAARLLKKNKKIVFLIIGDGAKKKEYQHKAMSEQLQNVKFIERQPEAIAPHIYSAAGVNIISLMPNGVKTALPSKTGICLSCGKPLVLCVEEQSKYAQLIESYDAGIAVGASNPQKLASLLIAFSERTVSLNQENIYQCFRDHFLKSINVQKYCNVIKNVLGRDKNV